MQQKEVNEIIARIAQENKLPSYVVEDIVLSQFTFLKNMMVKGKKEQDFKVLLLHKLGKFYPSLEKLRYINIANENRRLREQEDNKDKIGSTTGSKDIEE